MRGAERRPRADPDQHHLSLVSQGTLVHPPQRHPRRFPVLAARSVRAASLLLLVLSALLVPASPASAALGWDGAPTLVPDGPAGAETTAGFRKISQVAV